MRKLFLLFAALVPLKVMADAQLFGDYQFGMTYKELSQKKGMKPCAGSALCLSGQKFAGMTMEHVLYFNDGKLMRAAMMRIFGDGSACERECTDYVDVLRELEKKFMTVIMISGEATVDNIELANKPNFKSREAVAKQKFQREFERTGAFSVVMAERSYMTSAVEQLKAAQNAFDYVRSSGPGLRTVEIHPLDGGAVIVFARPGME